MILLFTNCNSSKVLSSEILKKPLNIILMIGDGMGLSQISAASFINGGLFLDQLLNIGLVKTSSADDYITDSAAGATAYSTGKKTFNGAIGVGPDSMASKTILEMANDNGLSVGLVSVCSITHATPGSFFGHQVNREMHKEIASDFYGKGIDFVAGTGKPYFDMDRLMADGYKVLNGKGNQVLEKDSKYIWFYNDSIDPPKYNERGEWLKDVAVQGVSHLSNNKRGFFMMVEGSQIDWGGHNNDFDYTVNELIDFDKAVKAMVEFARKDGNTLVIVTADHETGGLSLNSGDLKNRTIGHQYASTHHSGTMVPVYAFGPGSELFRGTMENTAIFDKMKTLLSL